MMIEDKFGGGSIRTNSSVYAIPRQIVKGDQLNEAELIARLQRPVTRRIPSNKVGYYKGRPKESHLNRPSIVFRAPHSGKVRYPGDRVTRLYSRTANKPVKHYWLEPEVVTNLFDADREKRTPVAYSELPETCDRGGGIG